MNKEKILIALVLILIALQGYQVAWGVYLRSQRPVTGVKPQKLNQDISIDLRRLSVKGAATARIAIVEFSDYECPYCARHAKEVEGKLDDTFVKSGKVVYAFANNPLPNHSNAKWLAHTAICAGQQNRYWDMHDQLFALKPHIETEIPSLARELGLNSEKLGECLRSDEQASEQIEADSQLASQLGFTGTPSFVIGYIDSQQHVRIQKMLQGAQAFGVFEKIILELDTAQNSKEKIE